MAVIGGEEASWRGQLVSCGNGSANVVWRGGGGSAQYRKCSPLLVAHGIS